MGWGRGGEGVSRTKHRFFDQVPWQQRCIFNHSVVSHSPHLLVFIPEKG